MQQAMTNRTTKLRKSSSERSGSASSGGRRKRRIEKCAHACAYCASKKLKCSGTRPCDRCTKLGQAQECHDSARKTKKLGESAESDFEPEVISTSSHPIKEVDDTSAAVLVPFESQSASSDIQSLCKQVRRAFMTCSPNIFTYGFLFYLFQVFGFDRIRECNVLQTFMPALRMTFEYNSSTGYLRTKTFTCNSALARFVMDLSGNSHEPFKM